MPEHILTVEPLLIQYKTTIWHVLYKLKINIYDGVSSSNSSSYIYIYMFWLHFLFFILISLTSVKCECVYTTHKNWCFQVEFAFNRFSGHFAKFLRERQQRKMSARKKVQYFFRKDSRMSDRIGVGYWEKIPIMTDLK